jgi:glycosyltransferase involved in cell wall biosynthesis
MKHPDPAVWLPAVRAGSGADVFTERLAAALNRQGIRAEISWLPHRAEYVPWSVPAITPPKWANIIHANSWLHSRFIPLNMPLVVTMHSCVHDPALQPYKNLLQSLYHRTWIMCRESDMLRRAHAVTAVSRYTAKRAAVVFGRSDILPIHNWIDLDVFRYVDKPSPHSPFRLLFVGNLNRRKGADLLPEIMRRLGSSFELRYTGNADDLILGTDSVPPNMISLGRLQGEEALTAAYRESDALLFPTRLEGFGLVALEAQACGRPVIATDCSSLPEVVAHNVSGLLCPVDDIEAYVAAARKLREERERWHQMCVAARDRACDLFAEQRALDLYVKLYLNLLSPDRH